MTGADMDIELQILQEFHDLETKGLKISPFIHVKAHQDRKSAIGGLSRAAQLNVKADKLASDFPTSGYLKQQYYTPTAVHATLLINNVPITARYKECLRHHLHEKELRDYVQKKWEWSDATYNNIWWKAHGTALKRLSHSDGQKNPEIQLLPSSHQ